MPITNRTTNLHQPYKPHKNREEKLNDLYLLAETLLKSNVSIRLKKKFFRHVIWEITAVDGTYKTRYRSAAVLGENEVPINHEHVWPVKSITSEILSNPDQMRRILEEKAVACIVSREEHNCLRDDIEGWERYSKANLRVKDMLTGNWMIG
ncbi:MAG: hypothetical protein WD048_06080 [Chitinophagales bacterium]